MSSVETIDVQISPFLISWPSRLLSKQATFVWVGGILFQPFPVNSDVVQGSVLQPIPFLFINDISSTSYLTYSFADDITKQSSLLFRNPRHINTNNDHSRCVVSVVLNFDLDQSHLAGRQAFTITYFAVTYTMSRTWCTIEIIPLQLYLLFLRTCLNTPCFYNLFPVFLHTSYQLPLSRSCCLVSYSFISLLFFLLELQTVEHSSTFYIPHLQTTTFHFSRVGSINWFLRECFPHFALITLGLRIVGLSPSWHFTVCIIKTPISMLTFTSLLVYKHISSFADSLLTIFEIISDTQNDNQLFALLKKRLKVTSFWQIN